MAWERGDEVKIIRQFEEQVHPRSHCAQRLSAISNPLLQTMLGNTVTAASTSLKTDTSYSEVMGVAGLSEGRGDVYETGSGLHLLYLGPCYLLWMCLYCSVTCIVCDCTSITLANSLNNVSTSRSSSSRSPPPK